LARHLESGRQRQQRYRDKIKEDKREAALNMHMSTPANPATPSNRVETPSEHLHNSRTPIQSENLKICAINAFRNVNQDGMVTIQHAVDNARELQWQTQDSIMQALMLGIAAPEEEQEQGELVMLGTVNALHGKTLSSGTMAPASSSVIVDTLSASPLVLGGSRTPKRESAERIFFCGPTKDELPLGEAKPSSTAPALSSAIVDTLSASPFVFGDSRSPKMESAEHNFFCGPTKDKPPLGEAKPSPTAPNPTTAKFSWNDPSTLQSPFADSMSTRSMENVDLPSQISATISSSRKRRNEHLGDDGPSMKSLCCRRNE
jgi:hypothetical protein